MKKLVLFFFFLFPIVSFAQALNGNYVIGQNQPAPYKTLTTAINHLKQSTVGMSGPVTFLLNDETYYSLPGETFPIVISTIPTTATKTLTIKPNVGKNVTIGTTKVHEYDTTESVIKLDGADNVIIDGSNIQGGSTRNLILVNNEIFSYTERTTIWLSSVSGNSVDNIKIINTKMTMTNRNGSHIVLSGIYSGGAAVSLDQGAGAQNDALYISNNEFLNVRRGVLIRGGNTNLKSKNITISFNVMGSQNTAERPSVPIDVKNADILDILDNSIVGFGNIGQGDFLSGIKVEESSNYNIKRNNIRDSKADTNIFIGYGIRVVGSTKNAFISENKIIDFENLTSSRINGIGIEATPTSSEIVIANNFIGDLYSGGTDTNTSFGIYILQGGTGTKIYHNTVSITQAQPGWSAAILFKEGTNFDVRNNIFSNTNRVGTVGWQGPYAIYNEGNVSFSELNNNNYFATFIGRKGDDVSPTLANWQTATGKDQNSISVNPVFVSTTDLHLQAVAGNAALDNKGTALPAITMDIDGQVRSTTTPDMGADEFSAEPAAITVSPTSLSEFSSCSQTTSASQSFTVSGTNLTANIVVTSPTGFEVSIDDITFSNSITYTQTSGSIASSMVYARMTPTSTAVSGSIAITSTGATDKNIDVYGAIGGTTTWNGSTWSSGAPTSTMTAIISGNYNLETNINACSLTVNTSAVVVIPTGYTVNLNGAITVEDGSSFTLENNASLIQKDASITNSGNITVKRYSSALKRLDYTLWSSPTSGTSTQTLQNFSPLTTANRFYTYKTNTNLYSAVAAPESTTFATAKGYLIRMPNTHPTTATVWEAGAFTGIPNNGDYSFTMQNGEAGKRFNLVGNPYPSPIDAKTFVNANKTNNITGALYFWRKTNDASQPSYYTWTTAGLTEPITTDQTVVSPFQGVIQTGQGFFVEAKEGATNLVFNNTMRKDDHVNQFYKSSEESAVEYNRFWLNATNAAGWSSQTLIAYFTDGTNDLDSSDGKYINDGDIAFTSLIQGVPYAIQGKALPFSTTDIVPMHLTVKNAGAYTIAIDHVDGLFEGAQSIYLRDNQTNTDHDLKTGSYTFNSEAGSFSSRFSIVYESTLGVTNPNLDANSIFISKNNSTININAGNYNIENVEVFDLLGRKMYESKKVNSNTASISNLSVAKQVILIKVTTNQGTITKKMIF